MRPTLKSGIHTPAQPPQGLDILTEAARLLQHGYVSPHSGGYHADGTHVSVSAELRWNDDHETIRLLLTCYAFGHRQVDWEGQPVWLRAENATDGGWVQFLDRHGQTMAPCLPQGTYRLALRGKRLLSEPVLSPPATRWAAGDDTAVRRIRQVWRGEACADGLRGTVEETEDGDVRVAFETEEVSLAGRRIDFHFVEPDSGLVCYSDKIMLTPARTPGKWTANAWLGKATNVGGPYHLVYEVVPPVEEDGRTTSLQSSSHTGYELGSGAGAHDSER